MHCCGARGRGRFPTVKKAGWGWAKAKAPSKKQRIWLPPTKFASQRCTAGKTWRAPWGVGARRARKLSYFIILVTFSSQFSNIPNFPCAHILEHPGAFQLSFLSSWSFHDLWDIVKHHFWDVSKIINFFIWFIIFVIFRSIYVPGESP